MKFKILLIGSLILLFTLNLSYSQIVVDTKAKVANVDFNLIDNELVITYDLLNTKPNEKFQIIIKISKEDGKQIDAKTLKGDVGENISGGIGKKIIWSVSSDIAYLDDQINVEVLANHQNPKIINPTSKGKAILLSTIYPGLGSAKITLKNVHLIKGVLAYGSVAGSFYFKNKSQKTFSEYQESSSTADRDKLYDQSIKEDKNSTILMYTAGAIWLIDYVTILISENRSQQKGLKSQVVYLGPSFDPRHNYKGMSLVINF